MGISPIKAIQTLLQNQKVSLEDIGVFEINEAFAASSIVVESELGLDPAKSIAMVAEFLLDMRLVPQEPA